MPILAASICSVFAGFFIMALILIEFRLVLKKILGFAKITISEWLPTGLLLHASIPQFSQQGVQNYPQYYCDPVVGQSVPEQRKLFFFSWLDCTQSLTWHIFLFQAVSGKDAPLNNFFFYDGVEGSGMVENFKWITKTLSMCCCCKKIIIWTGKKVNKTIKSQNCVLASSHDWLHVVEWQVPVCIPRVLQCEGAININYPQHFA